MMTQSTIAKRFSIIAAIDEDFGIGKEGRLPWKIRADMQYFKALTMETQQEGLKNAVMMGRVTWESLPEKFRPLPDRLNVVISKTSRLLLPSGVLEASGIDEALNLLHTKYGESLENIYVIGGAKLYEVAIRHSQCRRIYLTRIRQRFDCDAFFPKDLSAFHRISVSPEKEEDGQLFCFEVYDRIL